MKIALSILGFTFVAFVLAHWLTSGQDNIIEGPPETPDLSFYQPSPTP